MLPIVNPCYHHYNNHDHLHLACINNSQCKKILLIISKKILFFPSWKAQMQKIWQGFVCLFVSLSLFWDRVLLYSPYVLLHESGWLQIHQAPTSTSHEMILQVCYYNWIRHSDIVKLSVQWLPYASITT